MNVAETFTDILKHNILQNNAFCKMYVIKNGFSCKVDLFLTGFSRFLDVNQLVHFSPRQHNLYCRYGVAVNWTSNMCSTLFILNMTFERFYSILKPHKAAAFNTVKRAKITILSCIIISVIYNSPHAFITSDESGQCVPYGKAMNLLIGQIYNWLSYITNFVLPFCLLLFMNSVIIQVLHKRSISGIMKSEEKGHNRSQILRMKKSERQIFVILLLVTFGFLVLTTPAYAGILYVNFVDFTKSAYSFAQFQLFYSLAQKLYYTNYGINFYLYVISGKKFRTDLINLLEFCKNRTDKDLDFNTESIQSNNDRSKTNSNTDQEIKP